jgi:hypothetical protein
MMATSNNGPRRRFDASNWGISDTDLLAIVDDLADENGWTLTINVRLQVGEDPEERDLRSGVGSRLAWMVRYGWLERHSDQPGEWRLTAMGHAILDGKGLPKAIERAFAGLSPAQRVELTRELAEGGQSAPMEIRSALRRQWQRSLGRPR